MHFSKMAAVALEVTGYFQSLKSFTKRNDLEIRLKGNVLKGDKSGQYVNAVESVPKTCEL